MPLFKYLPLDRLDVLANLKIRFSQLSSLNDPFETYHSIDIKTEVEDEEYQCKLDIEKHWGTLTEAEQSEQKEDYLNTLNNLKEESASIIESAMMTTGISQELDANLGVFSLSRSNEILLMWSHYADSGQGFVIEFNTEHEFFNKRNSIGLSTTPIVVKYSDRCPILKRGSACSTIDVLGVKPIQWSYEQEERITINFSGLKPSIDKKTNKPATDNWGNKIYLIDIPQSVISAIYFGPRMTEESKKNALSLIRENKINCKLHESRISKGQYRIEFNEIDS